MNKTYCSKIAALLTAFLLTSCGAQDVLLSASGSNESSMTTENSVVSSSVNGSNTEIGGGGIVICQEHTMPFHSVDATLINAVGQDEAQAWFKTYESLDEFERPSEGFTIAEFINHFNVSKEDFTALIRNNLTDDLFKSLGVTEQEYYEKYGYTDAQIEALYSGNQAAIDEAFCGPLAFVNEADGELYSIYWLAEHTPEEYVEAGLPMEEVEAVIEKAASEEFGLTELAETAQSKFALALSLESEALPVE